MPGRRANSGEGGFRSLRRSRLGPSGSAIGQGENPDMARRSYGTGSLIVRTDSTGRESWHAKVRIGKRQVWLFEADDRHAGPNIHVLFSDGMVEAISKHDAMRDGTGRLRDHATAASQRE